MLTLLWWGLLGLLWTSGTYWLVYIAAVSSGALLGEQPTADERATSMRWGLAALACWVGTPLVGLVVELLCRRRVAALLFTAVLVGSVLTGWALGVSWGVLPRDPRDVLTPTTSTVAPQRAVCQERSGGDTRCPGG
jgi:hypothetical protein